MTTHETQPEFLETAASGEHAAPMEQEPVQQHQPPVQQHEPVSQDRHTESQDRHTDQTLFGDGELSNLRLRWTEVQAHAAQLLRDVHLLASNYGWREAEILNLSPVRRQAYLELIAP